MFLRRSVERRDEGLTALMYRVWLVALQTLLSPLLLICGFRNLCLSIQTPRWALYRMLPTLPFYTKCLLYLSFKWPDSYRGTITKLILSIRTRMWWFPPHSMPTMKLVVENTWITETFSVCHFTTPITVLLQNIQATQLAIRNRKLFNVQCN